MAIPKLNKVEGVLPNIGRFPVSSEKGELRGRPVTRGASSTAVSINPFVPDAYRVASTLAALTPRNLVDRCRDPGITPTGLQEIIEEIERRYNLVGGLQQFSTIDLVLLVHVLTKRSIAAPQLFDWVAEALINGNPDKWKPQDLSMLAWSFATAKRSHSALFQTIGQQVEKRREQGRLGEFDPQHLTNLPWSFATIGHHDKVCLMAIAEEVAKRSLKSEMVAFTPQNLSILLWSYSTLKTSAPGLFDAVSSEVASRFKHSEGLSAFTPQNLTLLLWSTASGRQSQPELVTILSREILARAASPNGLAAFNSQNLSNIFWSLATIHSEDTELINAIKSELSARYQHGDLMQVTPQHLSNTAWSLASLGDPSENLLKPIQNEVLRRSTEGSIVRFTPQDFASLAWAYSTLNVGSTPYFRALTQAAVQKGLDTHTAQGLLMFLWSVTKSAALPKDEMDAFFLQVQNAFEKCERSITDTVLFLWCAAIHGSLNPSQFNPLLGRIAQSKIGRTEIRQLLQVRLACQVARCTDIVWPPALTHALDEFLANEPQPQSSAFHQEVAKTVDAVLVAEGRPPTKMEGKVEIYFVDMLLPGLVVQVNGPHHSRGDAIEAFRDRQLESLGYPVKKIWWDQWQRLKPSERSEYCRKLLST